jgi:Yip1 domain
MSSISDDPPAPPNDDPPLWPPPVAAEPPRADQQGAPPAWSPEQPPYTPSSQAPPPYPPTPAPGEPLSPWVHIWTRPRAVMRQILDGDPRRMVHRLAILGGVAAALGANVNLPGMQIPLTAVIVCKLVFGVVGALLGLYLFSALVLMTGRWLGGRGTFVTVRSALAWSNVPVIWAAILWLPLLVYMGWDAFNINRDAMLTDPIGLMLLVPIGVATAVVVVWRCVILCKIVGEAHGFSAWHSLGAFLIAILLVAIPVGIIVTAFVLLGFALLGSH